jgi:TonB family protein
MRTGGRRLVRANAWIGALVLLGMGSGVVTGAGETRDPRIVQDMHLGFPTKMRTQGVTSGEVHLLLDIDATGTLVDHLIVAYTHYEFANEVSRTLPRWHYEPALVNGQPVASTVRLQINFGVSGMLVVDKRLPENPPEPGKFMFRARELSELDAVPKALVRVAPRNPASVSEASLVGRTRVEFYIDEEGCVRMPTVVSADDERLGWAALGAIAKWRFEIPRRGGFPVLVRARQDFVFEPEP